MKRDMNLVQAILIELGPERQEQVRRALAFLEQARLFPTALAATILMDRMDPEGVLTPERQLGAFRFVCNLMKHAMKHTRTAEARERRESELAARRAQTTNAVAARRGKTTPGVAARRKLVAQTCEKNGWGLDGRSTPKRVLRALGLEGQKYNTVCADLRALRKIQTTFIDGSIRGGDDRNN